MFILANTSTFVNMFCKCIGRKEATMTARSVRVKSAAPCCVPLNDARVDVAALTLSVGFAALSDPARLRLFSLIASAPPGEACACDLIEPIGKSQPTVSHHLKILTEAGLVHREKRGVWAWYRANSEKLALLRSALG